MNASKNALKIFLLVAAGALLFPRHIYGYIDPGTGSYVFQIIVAAFVAISFAVKIFWHKIKNFFRGLFAKKGQ
jgi:hypothetical protein